jgi:hypothetical protein
MRNVLGLLCLLSFVASGCKEEREPAPFPPSIDDDFDGGGGYSGTGGGGVGIPGGGRDSGRDDEEDAGSDSGTSALALVCDDFLPIPPGSVDPVPGVYINRASSPADFEVTRTVVAWESSCMQPTIRITLSDGDCPEGDGHALTFIVPAAGIDNGDVLLGQNVVTGNPGSNNISVRYTRPDSLDLEPHGEWGSCAGASGTIELRGELQTDDDSAFVGQFQLELTRCDGGEESVQQLIGEFGVELPAGLLDVCTE